MLLDLVRVLGPQAPAVALPTAKTHLRVDGADEDTLIAAYVAAAIDHLDGYAGILGRCLCEQTWRLRLARFPAGALRLPLPPLIAVEEIRYLDAAGEEQLLDPSAYVVTAGPAAEIRAARGAAWPSTLGDPGAVSITFTCGYGDPEDVPPALIAAILLTAGDLYAFRETAQVGATATPIPANATVTQLVRPYRIPRT